MMTVAEEMARAVQIASAPPKFASRGALSVEEVTSNSSANVQEVTNRSASKTAASSDGPISSSISVTVQRSSACSLIGNSEVEVDKFSDGKEVQEIPVKLKRPRDAQLEKTVTCTDCGTEVHWAGLTRHRKMCHPRGESLEGGVIEGDGGIDDI